MLAEHSNKVVNCKTFAEASELMSIYHANGWTWINNDPAMQRGVIYDLGDWYYNKANTCYSLQDKFTYGDIDFYTSQKMQILSLNEFKQLENMSWIL